MEIWKLESDFCSSMMKRDCEMTISLFNDSIAASLSKLNHDSVFYSYRYGLFEYPYFAQNIYYQKSLFRNTNVEVFFDDEDFNTYKIEYVTANKKTAITTANGGDGDIQYILVTVFGKYKLIGKLIT